MSCQKQFSSKQRQISERTGTARERQPTWLQWQERELGHIHHEVCQGSLGTTGAGDGQLGAGLSPALQGKPPPEIRHLPHQLPNLFLHPRHIQALFSPPQQPGLICRTNPNHNPLSAAFKLKFKAARHGSESQVQHSNANLIKSR